MTDRGGSLVHCPRCGQDNRLQVPDNGGLPVLVNCLKCGRQFQAWNDPEGRQGVESMRMAQ